MTNLSLNHAWKLAHILQQFGHDHVHILYEITLEYKKYDIILSSEPLCIHTMHMLFLFSSSPPYLPELQKQLHLFDRIFKLISIVKVVICNSTFGLNMIC